MSQDKRDIAIEKAKKIIEQYPDKNDYVCKYIVRSYDHNNNPTDDSIELDEFWEDCKRIIALPSKEQGTGAEGKDLVQKNIDLAADRVAETIFYHFTDANNKEKLKTALKTFANIILLATKID